MHSVSSITLNDLKVLPFWSEVPLGALVQATTLGGDVFVGMRCAMEMKGFSPKPCLLVLDGDDRGLLVEGESLRAPALDVSALFEVCVADPSPRPYTAADRDNFGIVCEVTAGTGCLVTRVRTSGGARGYAYMTNWAPGISAGDVTLNQSLPDADLVVIGPTDLADRPRD